MQLTTNIGTTDRIIRIAVGVLLIGLALLGQIGVWGWLGIVPLATAFLRFCPAYTLFGVRTCKEC